jgi:putative inorganic carbon (hco3(-)) transporter
MIVWSLFAAGGVYVWAGVPLIVAAAVLAVIAPPTPGTSRETRALDGLLLASIVAAVAQLVPLPAALRAAVAPHVDGLRSALYLGTDTAGWWPLSVSPGWTAYSLGLVTTALLAFWTARKACAFGLSMRIVRHVAFAGLVAALVALADKAAGDPTLIYSHWTPRDPGARPFGPFVNRNHFATWVLMACPLAAGYVAALLSARRPPPALRAKLVTLLESLGTSTLWVGVAVVVMTLALAVSTSRSGLIAFSVSLVGAAWLARGRLTRRTGVLGLLAIIALAALVAAYVNVEPLLSRVDETLAVGAAGRPRIWQETLRLARDFWLTGAGLGSYQTAMLVYQQTDRAVFINQAHNQYLHFLAEGGVLLTVPAVMAVVAFIRLFRMRLAQDISPSMWLRIGGGAALLAVAVQGIWETGLRMPANGLLLAIAAAVAVHRPAEPHAARAGEVSEEQAAS